MYYPLAYYTGTMPDAITAMEAGRQKQVVRLIRLQFLKRFESSPRPSSCRAGMLLKKLLAFVDRTTNRQARRTPWNAGSNAKLT